MRTNANGEAADADTPTLRTTGLAADYLELLKGSLTATIHQDVYVGHVPGPKPTRDPASWHPRSWPADLLEHVLQRRSWRLARRCAPENLGRGTAWPLIGETMVGIPRLNSLQACIEQVVADGVPGDLIETGVWRGGASIFMRGVLRALEVIDRRVWVADSFQGLPPPDPRFEHDNDDPHHEFAELAVSLESVKENFRRYGLLDERVMFLPGWFRDTLGGLAGERWAVIRLDGDMYESTMDALSALYPRLSVGGYVIIDDGSLDPCRAAVEEYRDAQAIDDPIVWSDWTGFFWRRSA